ncbi:TPA: hypothetical protein ACYUQ5_001128 [Legionella pneumophila]
MKFYHSALVSFAFLSLAYNAKAGTLGIAPSMDFYANAGLGAVFSNTSTSNTSNSNSVLYTPTAIGTSLFTLPNINWQNKFKNGYGINLAVGKYFSSNWHGDLEFLYQNIERETLMVLIIGLNRTVLLEQPTLNKLITLLVRYQQELTFILL